MSERSAWRAAGPDGSGAPTPRGVATRSALIAAARRVFERDGFLGARTTVIADEAGVARGSFYTYFRDKEEVFAAVLHELQDEMLHPPAVDVPDDDPIGAIRAANRAYLLSYRRNRVLMAQMELAALLSDDFRRLRQERTVAFTDRNARAIARLQQQGLADPSLDPHDAAIGVSAMVSGMARQVFLHGSPMPLAKLVELTTALYVNALGLRRPDAPQP